MSVFTDVLLDDYLNVGGGKILLNLDNANFTLLNLKGFYDWCFPEIRSSDRIRSNSFTTPESTSKYNMNKIFDKIKQQKEIKKILGDLTDLKCINKLTGRTAIGQDYGKFAIQQIINKEKDFDILVAVEKNYNDIKIINTNDKLKKITGFIIVQLGECINKPSVWSVNLICTDGIKSTILLGAFLYCIKLSTHTQEGILELAGGYENIAGFISYTKMGFNKNLSLIDRDCFENIYNLPMSIDLRTITPISIIDRAIGYEDRKVNNTEDDTELYNLRYKSAGTNIDKIDYNNLIIYNNLLYKLLFENYTIILVSTELSDKEKLLLDEIKHFVSPVSSSPDVHTDIVNELKKRINDILRKPCVGDSCITRCTKGICRTLGSYGIMGGKIKKTRKYKTRKYKTRKYKIRKYKTRKYKTRKRTRKCK